MDDVKELTEKLDYLMLRHLVNGLQNKKILIPQAKNLAIQYLKLKPYSSVEEAQKKIASFVNTYPQFTNLKEYIMAFEYEQKVDQIINKMKQYIDDKNIDDALKVAGTK